VGIRGGLLGEVGATVTSMARKRWSRVWKDDTRRTKRSATRGVDAPTDPAKAALRARSEREGWWGARRWHGELRSGGRCGVVWCGVACGVVWRVVWRVACGML